MSGPDGAPEPEPEVSGADLWRDFARRVWRRTFGRAIVKDVGPLSAAQFATAVLAIVQGIVVARLLGPRTYGVAALAMSYPSAVYAFFATGSSDTAVRFLNQFVGENRLDRARAVIKLTYVVNLGTASVAFLVVLVSAPFAARVVVRSADAVVLLIVYSVSLVAGALTSPSRSVLSVGRRFGSLALLQVGTATLRFALVVGFVAAGLGFPGVVWGNSVAQTLGGVAEAVVAERSMRRRWGGPSLWLSPMSVLRGRRRQIARFLVYTDLDGLLALAQKKLDMVLLGTLAGATAVGYYKLATSISSASGYIISPLRTVLYPTLTKLWGRDERLRFRRTVRRYALYLGLPLGALGLMTLPVVPFVVRLVAGPAFDPAAGAAQFLVLASVLNIAFFWARPALLTVGAVRYYLVRRVLQTVLFFGGVALLVPPFEHTGMAALMAALSLIGSTMDVAHLRWRSRVLT